MLALVACGHSPRRRAGRDAGTHAASADGGARASSRPTIFDDAYAFTCSPQADVGCRGVFPVRTGPFERRGPTSVVLLSDGNASLAARVASLRAARRSIRIQALIFRGDDTGLTIADLLKQKKAEGVDVHVIVDAASNLDWETQWMYFDLKRHGIEVEGYEALYMQWLTAEIVPGDPLRPNKRFHDKMWVVDGEDPEHGLAIVGGLNIANEYFRVDPTPLNRWRDQDVLVRGAAVGDVMAAFDRNAEFFLSIKGRLPSLFNPNNAWHLARGMEARIGAVRAPTWRKPTLTESIAQILAAPREGAAPRAVVARFIQSRPRLEESYIGQAYLDLIGRARESIYIGNAYFVPSRALIDALQAAARRGVKVVIVTNSPATNDIAQVAAVSRFLYGDVLLVNREEGVRRHLADGGGITIREWQGAPFGEGTLHAKIGIFDGVEAIIGSYNLDPRSERLNSETAIALRGEDVAGELERWFTEEYVTKSAVVSYEQALQYRQPGDAERLFELAFSLPMRSWL